MVNESCRFSVTKKWIKVTGAREHNLKDVDVKLPRDKVIVITGLSGSGKSSLAFDTIYAEGQRKYVESLSTYARQFLGQMQKPDVDAIEGLSPAVSIEQRKSELIQGRLLQLLQRYMTTLDYYLQVSGNHIALNAESLLRVKVLKKLLSNFYVSDWING